ncbi:P-type ATPase [Sesbania bispinosa]|nr:P-type ATPase [Sesbania bispinosa]
MRGRMTPKNAVEDGMRRGKDVRRKTCVEEGTLRNMAAHDAQRKGWWSAMAVFGGTNIGYNEYPDGAPEIIQERLTDIPPSYVETYKKYTRQGSRVLALAYKSLPDMTTGCEYILKFFGVILLYRSCLNSRTASAVSEARSLDRDIVESGLTFAGFAVFNCPIRSDSGTVLYELKGSSHDLDPWDHQLTMIDRRIGGWNPIMVAYSCGLWVTVEKERLGLYLLLVFDLFSASCGDGAWMLAGLLFTCVLCFVPCPMVMITGDQALTACHVASQVHIISKPTLILSPASNGEGYNWVSPDETETICYSEKKVQSLAETHDLCVGGDCIEMLQQTSAHLLVIPHVKVFARVSPEHKELIMTTFKTLGRVTLMCGDGTNDVGALKQAHVGVALLNVMHQTQSGNSSSDSSGEERSKSVKQKKSRPALETSGKTVSTIGEVTSKAKVASRSDSTSHSSVNHVEIQQQKLKKMIDELNEEGDGGAPIVKLGDASMASPFTAKHASVVPTTDIIRQGRSTLVTTLQMFKILGLNCLATAYMLSVMYLDGVKLGDLQATIRDMFTAAFFFFISNPRPLPTLSAERPHTNIFCAYVFLSLLGQFSIHLFFLTSSVREAGKYMPDECIEPDSDFHPNLVNTVSYMVSMIIQVATFAVNYMGHPFNQSIPENKPFLYALVAAVGFFTVITSDLFRDLDDWLKLVSLPPGLRDKLLIWAFLMFSVCYSWERFLRWTFPGNAKIPVWKEPQQVALSNLEKEKRL